MKIKLLNIPSFCLNVRGKDTCFCFVTSLCLPRGWRLDLGDFWLEEEGLHHSLSQSDLYHPGKFPLWLLRVGCEHIWSQQETVRNLSSAEELQKPLLHEARLWTAVSCSFMHPGLHCCCNCVLSHRELPPSTASKKWTERNTVQIIPTRVFEISSVHLLLMVWGLARSHLWFRHTK